MTESETSIADGDTEQPENGPAGSLPDASEDKIAKVANGQDVDHVRRVRDSTLLLSI